MNYDLSGLTIVCVLLTFLTSMIFTLWVAISVTNRAYKGDEKLHKRINKLEDRLEEDDQ